MTLAFEENSKPFDLVSVADVDAKECVEFDDSLVEIFMLLFGRNFEPDYLIFKVKFCQDFEANFSSRL